MDGLARDLEGHLHVVRLAVNSPAGRELGQRWHFRFTPTFILFDGRGQEIWRSLSVPDPAAVRGLAGVE